MANFNLPFGIRVSNDSVLDASRYVVDNIAARDFIITDGRSYNGLQTYVKDNSTLYILKDVSNSIWGIIPDLSTIAISDASKLNNYTDTFYGDLTIDGSIVISGNIIQDGSYYVTNVEEITSKNEFITLRDDAITPLNDGSISGIRISKADGSTNVVLGAGNDAVMRVGWEGDNLLAIATREDNPTNYGYAYWDESSTMFKTDILSETVSRTIYVETTGSDETGDGTSVSSAYATIGKALSTVKKVINTGVTVTIKIGVGTFSYTVADESKRALIQGLGTLRIEGTMTLVNSGFTLGTADPSDAFTYAVSGGDTSTWTANQWQFYCLKKPGSTVSYYPITHNTSTNISTVISTTGILAEIYQYSTILSLPDVEMFMMADVLCELNSLRINGTQIINFIGKVTNDFSWLIANCYFNCTVSKSVTFMDINRVDNVAFNNYTCGIYSKGIDIYNNLYSKKTTTYCFAVYNDFKGRLGSIVAENPDTGGLSCGIYIGGENIPNANTGTYPWKFINCRHAILYNDHTSTYKQRLGGQRIILNNVSYFMRKHSISDGNYFRTNMIFKSSNIYGAPTVRWFYDSMYEFININSGRNIQITGLIYPEMEVNQAKNIINNTTTPIIIGDVSQNMSISLDYTVKRSTALRKGKIDFMHDGSSLYQSPDSFMCSSSILDASALYFNSDVSGNLIRFNAIMDSGSDASLFYNVSRVMKTPLTI